MRQERLVIPWLAGNPNHHPPLDLRECQGFTTGGCNRAVRGERKGGKPIHFYL